MQHQLITQALAGTIVENLVPVKLSETFTAKLDADTIPATEWKRFGGTYKNRPVHSPAYCEVPNCETVLVKPNSSKRFVASFEKPELAIISAAYLKMVEGAEVQSQNIKLQA